MSAQTESYSYAPKSNNYEIFTAARNAKTLIKVTGCIQHQEKLKDAVSSSKCNTQSLGIGVF